MGQLNILHHKSWHVYNRENRAKVKTDEEQAQRKHEHAEQQRIQAEREYRLEILRKRARERQNAPDPKGMLASSSNNGRDVAHVAEDDVGQTGPCSILSMPRAAVEPEYSPQSASAEMTAITTTTIATTTTTTNDSRGLVYGAQDLDASERTRPKKLEHRAEKKPEIGLYLGQSATRASTPWYARRRAPGKDLANDKTLRTKDEILKLQNDPLTFVRSSLKKSREAREQHAREARALLEGQQASLGNRPDSEREYSITEDKYRYSSQYNPEATYEASRHHSNSMRRARLADGDDGRDEEERKRARRDGDSRQSQSSHRDNHRHHHRHEERKSRRRRLRHTLHSRRSKSPSSERRICGD